LAFGVVVSISIIAVAYVLFTNLVSASDSFREVVNAYFQVVVVFAAMLTVSYVLVAPRHPDMRFFNISSDQDARIVHGKMFRIVLMCFVMSSAAMYFPTSGHFLSGLAVVYGFLELFLSGKSISQTLMKNNPKVPCIALKLTNFLNEKIVYLCLAGMCTAVWSNYSPPHVFFFESLENIFCVLAEIFCLQILISVIIGKFTTWAKSASSRLYARNLIDICNVLVVTSYVIAVCFALKQIGFDLHRHIFRDEIMVVLGIIWADVILYKGFKGFTVALMKDAGAEKTENFDYTLETNESDYTIKVQTFLPTVSLVFYMILFAVSGLVILSNLNIDVAPLLAVFTVFGAAVGLAAQDLIRSFMNGLVFLFEKNLYVGEYIKINGTEGTVEKLSARALYLRELNGAVHTIPYNVIGSLTSYSHNYLYHNGKLPINTGEDVERISQILSEVVEKMKTEEGYRDKIIGSVEVFGLCPFDLTGTRMSWRIKTSTDFTGLNVKYEIYKRLYAEYERRGIHMPQADSIMAASGIR
jgi:small-conductance mechanosensitive channel